MQTEPRRVEDWLNSGAGMMMGLGSYGYGGPSSTSSAPSLSSSSNLSALAPPFTVVDRFGSKPSSNSAVQYPESPYTPSFGPTWQSYGSSLAHKPAEMEVDSTTRITSVPLPDDYSFQYPASMSNDPSQSYTWSGLSPSLKTSSGTFLFDGDFGKMDSYYKPYGPSMVDHDSSLVGHSEPGYDLLSSRGMGSADLSSQADYTHNLHGLEYHTPFHAAWNGAFDGKISNQAEASATSFLDNATAVGFNTYKKPMVQGNASCGQFSSVIARENSNSFSRMERNDNTTHSVQSVLSSSLDSTMTTISGTGFAIQAASYVYPTMSHSGSVSVTKSSPALVIRPPPSSSATVPQKSPYGKTPSTANDAAFHSSEGLGQNNPLNGNESYNFRNSEDEEHSAFTSQVKRQKDGNSQLFSAGGEVPSQSNGMSGSKGKLESPVRSIDATDGSLLSFDMGRDCLEHHTYAVDSPCWKGAPGSSFSPFDNVETESKYHFGSKTEEYVLMDLQHQTFPLPIDPVRCSPARVLEDKLHAKRGASANPLNILEADCTAREQSIDAAKTMWKGSNLMSSGGVQFSEDFDVPKHLRIEKESKSSGVASTSDRSFRAVAMGSVLNLGDTTEGDVAVRAAENVLCSPSSEESASELAKSYGAQSPPKMDVQALIKTLHGVSDMLLFSCLNDSYALKGQEIEIIKHAIANLNKLASKKVDYFADSKEAQLLQEDSCDKLENTPNPQMIHPASKHESENEEGKKLGDCLSNDNKLGNDYATLEKAGIFQSLDSPTDDLDVLGDGTMSQAIKKVLEENFPCGKEMESQAQLFKNLWLDAEAKLCSISYRVRFERMKAEMQKFKADLPKESGAAPYKTSGSNSLGDLSVPDVPSPEVESDSNPKLTKLNLPSSSSTCTANDVEASVMSRFDTLRRRDDLQSEEADNVVIPSPLDEGNDTRQNLAVELDGDDVMASVMNRFHILKCRDDLKTTNVVVDQAGKVGPICSSYMMPFLKGQSEDIMRLNIAVEPHYSQTTGNDVSSRHTDGLGYELVKDFFPAIPAVEVTRSNVQRSQYSLGSSRNSSSDWEHVVKEDAWRFV